MGSASSKVARASPGKKGKLPSWTGARIPPHDPKVSPLPTARQPWASGTKDEAIQRDAKDPHLLANLNRLGAVRVDHHMQTVRTQQGSLVNELFESRERAEEEAARARSGSAGTPLPRNRLHVSSLVTLLEERLNIGGRGATAAAGSARQLAEKYGMDVERLESLARFVNVPGVREGESVRRYVRGAQSGEDVAITEVEWREPTNVAG